MQLVCFTSLLYIPELINDRCSSRGSLFFSGCLQGIESCALTWAPLRCWLHALVGTSALYKRWQAAKPGVVLFGVKVGVPVAWQSPPTLWVVVSPPVGWASPKDLLSQQIQLFFFFFYLHHSFPARPWGNPLWLSSPLLNQRKLGNYIQVCVFSPIFSSLPQKAPQGGWCVPWLVWAMLRAA